MKMKEVLMEKIMQDPYGMEKQITNTNTNTMSELKVSGKIEKILPVESGTSKAGKEWKKQSFVVNTGAEFNPTVCFGVFGDEKIAAMANHKEGDSVEVLFNLSSREFDGKYYHNVDAWKITTLGAENATGAKVESDSLPF